jgi:hypothetical protein
MIYALSAENEKRTTAFPFHNIPGISHIVTQLVAIREFLNIFYGNEIVFGIILANWMLLMGIGSYLGKLDMRGRMR